MSSLSELIKFKEELIRISDELSISSEIDARILKIQLIISDNIPTSLQDQTKKIINRYKQLDFESQNILNQLSEVILEIDNQIYDIGSTLIQAQHQDQDQYDSIFLNLQNSSGRNPMTKTIRNLVSIKSLWYFPGLQLYPISKEWIDLMVSNDPLYLISSHHDVMVDKLKDKIKDYPAQYQKRLRLYTDLDQLPKNQFGVILIWSVFNHMPFNFTVYYLKKCQDLLRPGGKLIFSYNNCDLYDMARLAEENILMYSSLMQLTKLCKELGYNIIRTEDEILPDYSIPISWVEVTKPGELSSVKRSQALGSVLLK